MTDRRLTPANGRVAAPHLKGQVEAECFVIPEPAQIRPFLSELLAHPDGARDRELLFGDLVDVYERRDGWAFVQAQKDGYCGYVRETDLAPPMDATHAVRVRQTHIYPPTGLKARPLARVPFNGRLTVIGATNEWAQVTLPDGSGLVHQSHLRPIDSPLPDPVETAGLFLGTPYLWGGNTGDGIDCSGLIQAICLAADIACPGDSDQQVISLGTPLGDNQPFRRNDLIFWKGHVAVAEDSETMIHATAHGMITKRENIQAATARIESQDEGQITARRRLFP